MEKTNKTNSVRKYEKPRISIISLDNEISLQLQSDPPFAPGESFKFSDNVLCNKPIDPFNLG